MFQIGDIVRIDYAIPEYWIEMKIESKTDKFYFVRCHAKSHLRVECPPRWKIESLQTYAKKILPN